VGMKTCPECKGDAVPDDASVCGYCGHAFKGGARWKQQRNRRALVFLAVVVVAAALLFGLVASAIDNSEKNACEDIADLGLSPSDC
jgi:hypothetical protein